MTYNEAALAQTLSRLLREAADLDPALAGALVNLDQYHLGGGEAVDLLIGTLDLAPGDTVLDVGSGLGGPARQIARRTGARVVGVDLAAVYVEAARDLTARAELSHLTEFHVADVADFHLPSAFDAAITIHVQMNVADKGAWFSQIGRRLAPGARLAVWEVCQPPGTSLSWPMPWSLDGTDSHLATESALHHAIEGAGFETQTWTDRTDWGRNWLGATLAAGGPAGPALPMLIDDGYTRMRNYAGALTGGDVEVWQGSFIKRSLARADRPTK